MRLLQPFDPTASSSGKIITGLLNAGSKLIIMNESSVNLLLTFGDGTTAQLPANWARLFVLTQPHYTILWQQQSSGGISSIQPTNQVIVEIYEPYEQIIEVYPQELLRQTNAGNQGGSSGSSTTLADDGRSGGATPLTIEATQTGNTGGSNLSIDNQGNMTLAMWNGTSRTIIAETLANATSGTDNVKLGDSAHQVHVLGKLLVDLAATVSGKVTASTGLALVLGSVSKISSFGPYAIAGGASTFVTHNLGVIPDFVLLVVDDTAWHQLPAAEFSTMTSTQVKLSNAGGGTANTRGIALKF